MLRRAVISGGKDDTIGGKTREIRCCQETWWMATWAGRQSVRQCGWSLQKIRLLNRPLPPRGGCKGSAPSALFSQQGLRLNPPGASV